MDRRDFHKKSLMMGMGVLAGANGKKSIRAASDRPSGETYSEPPKNLPVRNVDVAPPLDAIQSRPLDQSHDLCRGELAERDRNQC